MAESAGQSNPQRSDTLTPEQQSADWWSGPNSVLHWLTGPQSILGGNFNLGDLLGIGQGNQPGTPNSALAVPELHAGVTERDAGPVVNLLGKGWADGTISQQDHDIFNAQIAAAIDANNLGELNTIADNIRRTMEQGELRQTRDRAREEIIGGTNRLADQFRPQMQAELDRFNNLINNPNQIRSDSQLGDVLAGAEETINRDVLRGRQQLRQNMATRGVSASGKAQGLARGLEERAAQSRSGLFDQMQNSIRGLRDTAQDRLMGFDQDIINARSAAEAGNFDMGYNLMGRGPDFFSPVATRFDTEGLRLAAESGNLGTLLNTIFGAAALGQNSMNQGMQFFQALPGMFRGG